MKIQFSIAEMFRYLLLLIAYLRKGIPVGPPQFSLPHFNKFLNPLLLP